MGYASEMSGEGTEFTINVVFSLVLHFLVFAGVFLTPSLYTQRFHMPVAYEVTLVELPGTRRVVPSRKRTPAVKRQSPKASTQVTPPPKTPASKVKPHVPPAPSETPALAGRRKVVQRSRSTSKPAITAQRRTRRFPAESLVPPRPIPQAPVPAAVLAPAPDGGSPGVVSESSVSTDKADPSLSYYLAAVQAKVSGRWIEPSLGLRKGEVERVTLGFTVVRSGLVRDIQVLAPSRNIFLNQSALRAVQEAVPLPPFPPLFPEETLLVRFHFEMRGQ